jgi:hypothetical protein
VPQRSYAQLKHLVESLRDDIGDMLSLLAESNETYSPQLGKIKDIL